MSVSKELVAQSEVVEAVDLAASVVDELAFRVVFARAPWQFVFVNVLTFFRFALVIPIWFLLHSGLHIDILFAFIFAVVAGNLDWMDGFFARRFGVTSRFGQFFDPVADKIFFLAALIALYEQVKVQLIVVIVMVEMFLVVHRTWVLLRKHTADVSANTWGKVKAILQNVVICALILGMFLQPYYGSVATFIIDWLGHLMLYVSLALSGSSVAGHIRKHGMMRMRL